MAPLSTSKLPPAMPPPHPHLPNPNPNPNPNHTPHTSSNPNNLFSIHANSAAFPPSYWNSDHHQQQQQQQPPLHFSASSSPSSSNASRNLEQEEHITGLDHGHGHGAAAAAIDLRHHHHHPHHHLLLHEDARAFMTDQTSGSYVMPKLESAAAAASAIKAECPASGEEGLMSHGGAGAGKRSGPERNVAMERPAAAGAAGGGMTMAIASLEDGSIGLKLGKRTYYEDSAGGGGGGGGGDPAAQEAAPMENSKNSSSSTAMAMVAVVKAANPNGKKQKPPPSSSSASSSSSSSSSSLYAGVVPKCQAEGCTADLSGSKEYHRRHKVCEWHSKASKARVANIEQRFCQQCSRFHVLSEFDEGKRSCRRRLAGHNERRRKPPQEPMSLLSPSFAFFPDGLRMNALLDHPCFSMQRRSPSPLLYSSSSSSSSSCTPYLACQLGLGGGAGPSSPHHGAHPFAPQSLSFSNTTSYGGAPSAPQLTLNPNSDATQKPSSETSISGRALSLLSSINSMAPHMDLLPLPLPLPLPPSSAASSALQISDEQVLHRHRHGHHHHHVAVAQAQAQASSSPCHGNNPASSASYDASCLMQPAFHSLLLGSNAQKSMMTMNHAFDSGSSSSSLMNAASSNTINGCSLAMDHEGKSMFSIMSSNNHNHIPVNDASTGFQNLQSSNQNPNLSSNQNPNMSSNQSHHNRSSGSSRPVLDLMQANSRPQIQTQQLMVQDAVPYTTDLQGLSIFGRQSII